MLDLSGSGRWLLLGGLLLIIVILTVVVAVQPTRPSGRLVLLPTATGAATATARPVTVTVTPTATPVCGLPQASWPRPAGDNGRGVHWCPSTRHATAPTERLVGAARELNLRWVLLVVGLDSWNLQEQYVREDAALIRALQGAGMMPIVRLGGQIGADDLAAFRRQVQALSKLGVRYYQIGNEPNQADENGGRPPDPVAYVQWWLPRAQIVTQFGGYPGFGALDPGGEYGDFAFLRAALLRLQAMDCGVLARTWLATHLYALGPLSEDYLNSPNGFARYATYDAVSREALSFSLPQIATEGGLSSLRAEWRDASGVTQQKQAEWIGAAYRAMPQTPTYFLAFNPWLLANLLCDPAGNPVFEYGAFFARNGAARPVVERAR